MAERGTERAAAIFAAAVECLCLDLAEANAAFQVLGSTLQMMLDDEAERMAAHSGAATEALKQAYDAIGRARCAKS